MYVTLLDRMFSFFKSPSSILPAEIFTVAPPLEYPPVQIFIFPVMLYVFIYSLKKFKYIFDASRNPSANSSFEPSLKLLAHSAWYPAPLTPIPIRV